MNDTFYYKDIKENVLRLFGEHFLKTTDSEKNLLVFNGTQYSTKKVPARTYMAQVSSILDQTEMDELNSQIRERVHLYDLYRPLDNMTLFITIRLVEDLSGLEEGYKAVSVKHVLTYFGPRTKEVESCKFETNYHPVNQVLEAVSEAQEYLNRHPAKEVVLNWVQGMIRNISSALAVFG